MKSRYSHWYYLILKLFVITIITLLSGVNSGCKDPYDYEPDEDTLLQAPAPPRLINPGDSAYYFLAYTSDVVFITFQWSPIQNVDFYEFEFDTSINFGKTAWSELTPYDTITFVFWADTSVTVSYLWRVRAASDQWFWWTDYSEVRTFIIPWAGSTMVHCEERSSSYYLE